MKGHLLQTGLAVLLACAALLQPNAMQADLVTVRHPEGLLHGFLVLRTLDGNTIADGDWIQNARGDRVTDRMIFHFRDGSLYDDSFVFVQRGTFRLLSEHLIEKGPAFKQPLETSLDAATGMVKFRYTGDDGKETILSKRLKLPPDLASPGMISILLKNLPPNVPRTTVSLLAATPKPRLVKLAISPEGEEPFSVDGANRKATRYLVKVEIGGVAGLIAPLVGEQPADTSVWILDGEAPSFLKSEGPLYVGGPIWRIELVSPSWPSSTPQH